MKTGKFWCKNCNKRVYLKQQLKNEQKIDCPRCGYPNLVKRENGKIKTI